MAKRRIAILGGGVGSLTAAFELTNVEGWQDRYEITVYQMGWRLGGKGASGRNASVGNRIEEHGLHIWMGFYENAFRMMRLAYAECAAKALSPGSPFHTWEDAFTRQDYGTNMERTASGWSPWTIHFPPNDQLPGDPALFDPKQGSPTPWDLLVMAIEWICRKLGSVSDRLASMHHPAPSGILGAIEKFGVEAEMTAVHCLERVVQAAEHSECIEAIVRLLDHIGEGIMRELEKLSQGDPALRHLFLLIDSGIAMVRGIIADGVLTHGFDAIDQYDLMEWLKRHGCQKPDNPFIRAGYDALFAYEKGDPKRPNISAGVSVYGMLRMMLTYRGSMFWRMNAGMGDAIFSPIYLALKARGVRFEFFLRATNVGLSEDKSAVESIAFDIQATVKNGEYQPLVNVKGVPSWPSAPLYDQLVEDVRGFDLESDYTEWHGRIGSRVLRRGVHFDDVVLGIPPAAARWICPELASARAEWSDMFANFGTVQTQAVQLWLNKTSAELGYPPPSETQLAAVTAYVEPYDTWADMSHLLTRETWPPEANVRNIAYLCNAFEDAEKIPAPFTDPEFPASQKARVHEMALTFLNRDMQVLWPKCGSPFDQSLIASQYLRANIDGTERYSLSLAGTAKYRLHPGKSGFSNLYLAGDWTYNVVNAGCVEAGVISGCLASRAICGSPEFIFGAFHSKEEAA